MRQLSLALLLTAAPCWAASVVDADEALASERLAARAREALDAILGPGRARVLVEVKGERFQLRTEMEMISPLGTGYGGAPISTSDSGTAMRVLDLPGYTKGKTVEPVMPGLLTGSPDESDKEKVEDAKFTQREHEQSARDGGFDIKLIQASVVLDSALPEDKVREVSQILPNLLMIDPTRGDTLAIMRSPFRPALLTAFAAPHDMRRAVYVGAAALAALLAVLIAGASFVRAARVFATELGRRRAAEDELTGGEPLPELIPGAPPGLLDAEGAPEGAPQRGEDAVPALGRRFDFLLDRDPAHCAHALSGEKPEDVALVMGYLAEAMPEVASGAFSLLSPDFQAEVSSRLLKLRVADPARLAEIEERLKHSVEHGVQGTERLGRILSRVPLDTRSDLLGRLTLRDHEGAADVERHLFTIEDIETLTPVELRRLIGAVAYEDWGFALRGVPAAIVERVLGELPEGPRELVRDILASPQPRDKVLDARSKILDARGALAAKGEIKMGAAEAGSELM